MTAEVIECDDCEARIELNEKVGTTCRYIKFCPACGAEGVSVMLRKEL